MLIQPSAQTVSDCAAHLLSGELLGLPTETVYGLAADAGNVAAVAKIYQTKGRPSDHPLIVHVSNQSAALKWIDSERMTALAWAQAKQLMAQYWPGPLTLIVPRAKTAPSYACAGQTTVGLRCPAHPLAQWVLQAFEQQGGLGVAAPSANRFGKVSPTTAVHVLDDLGSDAPWVLDGGACEYGIESTIIDLSRDTVRVLRPGSISQQQIAQLLNALVEGPDAGAPKVPGSLAAHYAPLTPVELVAGGSFMFRANGVAQVGEPAGVLSLNSRPEALRLYSNLHWVQAAADASIYAQYLYSQLRGFDQLQLERLLIELPPAEPQWAAVNDRLLRCAKRL
jgi:L-threonylcarbamoyladenylate synthase